MRRSHLFVRSLALAGLALGPAGAQEAAGPSTSGGNLPYIAEKPPGLLRKPEPPAAQPGEAAAPADQPSTTEPPVKTTTAPPRPEAPQIEPEATAPRAATPPPRQQPPPQPRTTQRDRREAPANRSTAVPSSPPPGVVIDRDPYAPTRPRVRAGRVDPEGRIIIERRYDDWYPRRPIIGFEPYPYVRRGVPGPVLRSFERPPVYQRRADPDAGCHYHAYPTDDMRFHRDVQCHWHLDPDDFSLRYVR